MRSLLLSEKTPVGKYVRIKVNFHIAIVKVKHRDLSREAARLIFVKRVDWYLLTIVIDCSSCLWKVGTQRPTLYTCARLWLPYNEGRTETDMEKSGILGSWILRNICLSNKTEEHCEFSTF
jgi:hypothetical protein